MFDVEICVLSWCEADVVMEKARAAGFQVEVKAGAIDVYSPAVFLVIWCAGNFDYSEELEEIVGHLCFIDNWAVTDDPHPLLN